MTENDIRKTIRRQDPSKATLSLGMKFAPSGSMDDQVQHLRKKAEAWADLLRVRKVERDAVWYSLTASILKTIEYPLLATTMSNLMSIYYGACSPISPSQSKNCWLKLRCCLCPTYSPRTRHSRSVCYSRNQESV